MTGVAAMADRLADHHRAQLERRAEAARADEVTGVVQHWFDELRRLVPTK